MIRKLTFANLLLLGGFLLGLAPTLVLAAQEDGSAMHSDEVILTDEMDQYPLGPHLEILEDPSGQLNIEDVTSPPYSSQFLPHEGAIPNYGQTDSAFWARFRVRNEVRDRDTWLLELGDGRMGFIDLFIPTSAEPGWTHKRAGRLLPFSTREIPYHNYVFSLPVSYGQEETEILLRLQSNAAVTFPLTIWSQEAFTQYSQENLLLLGLFYGAMLIMIVYNLFLFLSLRDPNYLYYVLFVICTTVNQASRDGIAHQYLWPDRANRYGIEIFGLLAIMFFLKLTTEFLQTKQSAPRLHKVLNIWFFLGGLGILLTPFVWLTNLLINFYLIGGLSLILIASVLTLWREFVAARLFLAAFAGVIIVGFIHVLTSLGIFSANLIATNGFYVSYTVIAVMLSLALADRINLLQRETQQANRELRASEALLTEYLEAMPIGVTIRNADGGLNYLNQFARKMGHWPDNFLGKPLDRKFTLQETVQDPGFYVRGTQQRYPLERLPPERALRGDHAFVDDVDMEVGEQRIPLEISSSPILNEQGHVQYAITAFRDISERLKNERRIQKQLVIEKTMATISTRFVQADDLDHAIFKSLEEVGLLLGFDRLLLFRLRPDRDQLEVSHEWCASGLPSLFTKLDGVTLADVSWLLGTLRGGNIVRINGTSDLPPEAIAEKQFIDRHFDGRLCAMSIWVSGEMDGLLVCHSESSAAPALENETNVLEMVDGMLSSALERARALETLEKRVDDRTRELDSLYRVTTFASAIQPLELKLSRSLEVITMALNCTMGAIHLRDGPKTPLRLIAKQDLPAEVLDELASPPLEEAMWQQVLGQDRPLMLSYEPGAEPSFPAWMQQADVTAYLGVPIQVGGEPVGVLSIFGQSGRGLTAEEMALLTTIADQLGTAIDSDRLRHRAQEARVMQERQRLARDLHDAVTQSLYSLMLFAEAATDKLQDGKEDRAHQYLVQIGELAYNALKEMRLLIYQLQPPALEGEGLVQAIRYRLEAVERRAKTNARLIADSENFRLPPEVEEALYRIAQEALNNVLKHTAATEIVVAIDMDDSVVDLAVRDNGQGFDPESARNVGGQGLNNIRQRIEALGGTLTLNSTPQQGTEVKVSVPVTWK